MRSWWYNVVARPPNDSWRPSLLLPCYFFFDFSPTFRGQKVLFLTHSWPHYFVSLLVELQQCIWSLKQTLSSTSDWYLSHRMVEFDPLRMNVQKFAVFIQLSCRKETVRSMHGLYFFAKYNWKMIFCRHYLVCLQPLWHNQLAEQSN